ncbi:hypothetical protein B0H16DRAFT_1794101 [Mycena metata]|uniref:BTB domain-containing protein n=1 Tax=Mycena metata TaxID=1033252 RepID=A0AAD7HG03_9AGAR|nr:hypothetical protein B0H16DRAFT_1794101 [Mycena metata]
MPVDDVPPPERLRTDILEVTETPPLTRSTEFWFEDGVGGNVIRQVESTQFRLKKSVLSMHSSVFRGMFLLALPEDETVDGCPVVVLSGDTLRDWVLFLGVIFPKFLGPSCPSLDLIAAILRLGDKYDFSAFRRECIERLDEEFKATLHDYDEGDKRWPGFKSEDTFFLRLASLAKEFDRPSLLPEIYYELVTRSHYILINPPASSDRLACLTGYVNLLKLQSTTTLAWLDLDPPLHHIPSVGCSQHAACVAAVIGQSRVCVLKQWKKDWEDGMCRSCRTKAKAVYEAGREVCWKQLPTVFGLPD